MHLLPSVIGFQMTVKNNNAAVLVFAFVGFLIGFKKWKVKFNSTDWKQPRYWHQYNWQIKLTCETKYCI